jgi:hypothetical protein
MIKKALMKVYWIIFRYGRRRGDAMSALRFFFFINSITQYRVRNQNQHTAMDIWSS